MTDRVRALLVTSGHYLLAVQQIRPGQDPYWVLPGGGVEAGEDLETALARELQKGNRTGPEFADPACGEYRLQAVPMTAQALAAIDLKPDELAGFLVGQLRTAPTFSVSMTCVPAWSLSPEPAAECRACACSTS